MALTALLIYWGDGPHQLAGHVIPPLGRLIDPVNGFWANAERADQAPPLRERPGKPYRSPVQIIYDQRRVPHIFAANDADLYRAQGYVTAADRLWQMEFQTAAAAGRLSEFLYHVAGDKVVEFDRLKRRSGMVWAARRTLEHYQNDSLARLIVESYTEGVNDYIRGLGYRGLPLEYKILDYRPEPWTPLKCALLLKYMAEMLTSDENDLTLTQATAILGPEYRELLFPLFPDTLLVPIVPEGTPFPACSDAEVQRVAQYQPEVEENPGRVDGAAPSARPDLGSNNWAVAGSRTLSGRPILCGDPHLGLHLPSLWYEVHLQAPGVNVYGVSLPGAPGIIIGFNEHIAWSMTNAMRDVRDWYAVRYQGPDRNAIVMDNGTEPVYAVVDTLVRRGAPPLVDTLRFTRWGPVVYDKEFPHPVFDSVPLALRWVAHFPGGEVLTIHHINRARNQAEFRRALETFVCPAQNFVYADRYGHIGIYQQGAFPAFREDCCRQIRNGTTRAEEWPAWIPFRCNPSLEDPSDGLVFSANQHPTGPAYPWVYSGDFEHFRNRRIRELLASRRDWSPESMQSVQLDNKNLQAELVLPLMLKALSPEERKEDSALIRELETWDYMNEADAIAPVLFHLWFTELEKLLWDELYRHNPGCLPLEFYTIRFLQKYEKHRWYDLDSTHTSEETRSDIIRLAFRNMVRQHREWCAQHPGQKPLWYVVKNTSLQHLLPGFTSFSLSGLRIGGGKHIVNACGPRWGPSWRMIVSLEDRVWAYGIYPGGPSGNPGSPWYSSSAADWAAGKYYKIILPLGPEDSALERMFTFMLL